MPAVASQSPPRADPVARGASGASWSRSWGGFTGQVAQSGGRVFENLGLGILKRILRILPILPEVVAASAPQTLPSTRAGG